MFIIIKCIPGLYKSTRLYIGVLIPGVTTFSFLLSLGDTHGVEVRGCLSNKGMELAVPHSHSAVVAS